MTNQIIPTVEVGPGKRKLVQVKAREIASGNVNGEFSASSNTCPPEGGSLCVSVLAGLVDADVLGIVRLTRKAKMLRCSWHGREFDIRTGKSWCHPRRVEAKRHDVAVEQGEQLVEGQNQIETYPIPVAERHVVLEL